MSELQATAEAMAMCMSNYVDMKPRDILMLLEKTGDDKLSTLINDLLIGLKSAQVVEEKPEEAKEAKPNQEVCHVCSIVHEKKPQYSRCIVCRMPDICDYDTIYECSSCKDIFCKTCFSQTLIRCSGCAIFHCEDCLEKCSKCTSLYCSRCFVRDHERKFCKPCVIQSAADFQKMLTYFC